MPKIKIILKPEEQKKPDKKDYKKILDDFLEQNNKQEKEDEALEIVMKLYEILDLMQQDTIGNINGLKEFFKYYKILIKQMKENASEEAKKRLDIVLKTTEEQVNKYLMLGQITNDEVNAFKHLLHLTEKAYVKDQKSPKPQDTEVEENVDLFSIPEVDELYRKLQEAIEKNDKKQITKYRGRLIRTLKKKRKEIESEYESVRVLDVIKTLLEQEPVKMDDISQLLSEENNSKYQEALKDTMSNPDQFTKRFEQLYQEESVRKKRLYKEALRAELKEHRRQLDDRYSKEFLDKKATIFASIPMLPKAVSLAVQRWINAINELETAKTNRRKLAEMKEMLKATGKLVGTPVVFLGKFVASNWYSIYMLWKGIKDIKEQEENVEAVEPEEPEVEEQKPTPATIPRERYEQKEERLIREREQEISEANPDTKTDQNVNEVPKGYVDPYDSEQAKPKPVPKPKPKTQPTAPPVEVVPDTSDVGNFPVIAPTDFVWYYYDTKECIPILVPYSWIKGVVKHVSEIDNGQYDYYYLNFGEISEGIAEYKTR